MNSTGRPAVSNLLFSTAALILCSRVCNSSDLISDLSFSVRAGSLSHWRYVSSIDSSRRAFIAVSAIRCTWR
jgi:hypothetical protein